MRRNLKKLKRQEISIEDIKMWRSRICEGLIMFKEHQIISEFRVCVCVYKARETKRVIRIKKL